MLFLPLKVSRLCRCYVYSMEEGCEVLLSSCVLLTGEISLVVESMTALYHPD